MTSAATETAPKRAKDQRDTSSAASRRTIEVMIDHLTCVLEDIDDGLTDYGVRVRAVAMELGTMDLRPGGVRVPKLQIGKRGSKEGSA